MFLANVQNTASLNFQAARAVLSTTRLPEPQGIDSFSAQWRASWRGFEVCAASADQLLQLAQQHIERSIAGLRRSSEHLLGEIEKSDSHLLRQQSEALRASFAALHEAQANYWQQSQQTVQKLVHIALTSSKDSSHGSR